MQRSLSRRSTSKGQAGDAEAAANGAAVAPASVESKRKSKSNAGAVAAEPELAAAMTDDAAPKEKGKKARKSKSKGGKEEGTAEESKESKSDDSGDVEAAEDKSPAGSQSGSQAEGAIGSRSPRLRKRRAPSSLFWLHVAQVSTRWISIPQFLLPLLCRILVSSLDVSLLWLSAVGSWTSRAVRRSRARASGRRQIKMRQARVTVKRRVRSRKRNSRMAAARPVQVVCLFWPDLG